MIGRVTLLALLVSILVAVPAAGSVVTSHIATDAEMLAQIEDLAFVCEGRIGDRGGAATYEVDIDTGALQAQYAWPNAAAVPFSIVYDNLANLLTFTVGGAVTLNYSPPESFTEIYIRTRAVNAGTAILLDSLILNGTALGDTSYADAAAGGLDILWVRGFDSPSLYGFALTGQSTMNWSGAAPTQSRLAYEVKFDNKPIPEPAGLTLVTAGLAGLAIRRFRG
jgi:hypothetical protein